MRAGDYIVSENEFDNRQQTSIQSSNLTLCTHRELLNPPSHRILMTGQPAARALTLSTGDGFIPNSQGIVPGTIQAHLSHRKCLQDSRDNHTTS